jgi:hypothetical protein
MPSITHAGLSWILCFAAVPQAQSRVIPLPDTLGANFAIADSLTVPGTQADYDAFLGMWHFRFQQRRPDGTYNPPFSGHWSFRKLPGARPVIEDHWRSDNPDLEFETGTRTYRAFHPQRKRWEIMGTSTAGSATWQPGVGWSDQSHRYLIQWVGPTTIMRFRYLAIEQNRFLWRADMSSDAGKSWTNDWWIMEATRVGR